MEVILDALRRAVARLGERDCHLKRAVRGTMHVRFGHAQGLSPDTGESDGSGSETGSRLTRREAE
jgi:hypothetical protein